MANEIFANTGTETTRNWGVQLGPIMQGQDGTEVQFAVYALNGELVDLSGRTITGTITNNETDETAALQGALTLGDAVNEFVWTTHADDVGTPGSFKLVFVAGADLITLPVNLPIVTTPTANTTFGAALVGVTAAERAWLTAALAALPDPSGLANYLPLTGGTLTGALQFSGTTHVGLRLNNLTTAQIAAVDDDPIGSVTYELDTSRVSYRTSTGWSSLLTSGDLTILINLIGTKVAKSGDTMTGNLTISNRLQTDTNTTPGNTRLLLWDVDTGALVRVSVGADDSGGTGYKVLRIPNG